MLLRKTGLILLMCICFSAVFSQTQMQNDFFSIKNFTPPAPEAAALGRYGDIPTDLSTGVPQISVPLYEIKSGKLSLPISISYHASGNRVQDLATPVGLGWVLNAGGDMSRVIIGRPDEENFGLLAIDTAYYTDREKLVGARYEAMEYSRMENLAHRAADTESDSYSFSVGDISGKFVYDVKKNMHITSPLDRQPKITWNADSTFTVLDDLGNKYYFATREHTQNLSNSYFYLTAWHLTKIISHDAVDSIMFYYRTAASYCDTTQSHAYSITVPLDETYFICGTGIPTYSFNASTNSMTHERKLIDSISFSNGYVKFAYADDREDILPERLTAVRISNNDGIIKEIGFKHSYFLTNLYGNPNTKFEKRLRLDSLKFNDKNSQNVNNYSFEYSSHTLPSYRNSAGFANNFTDYWGYYNGMDAPAWDQTALPAKYEGTIRSFMIDNLGAADNSRLTDYRNHAMMKYSDPDKMDGCILQKINYPTGGYTSFRYEANRLDDSGDSASYRGGLRVTNVVSFDTINRQPIIKTYRYNSPVSINRDFATDFSYTESNLINSLHTYGHYCSKAAFHISTNPINSLGSFNGSPVIYGQVTEYNGFPGANSGKTVYEYDTDADSTYGDPDAFKYTNYSTDKSWARGNLVNKKIYKIVNDSSILVNELRNYYTILDQHTIKVGQMCDRRILRDGSITNGVDVYMQDSITLPYDFRFMLFYYEYFDIIQSHGLKKLSKTEEIDYLNHNITSIHEYLYGGNNHLYPSKTLTYTSKSADTLIEKTKYPQDRASISGLTSTASNALDSMVAYNIKAIPIETEQYRNNQFLTRNRTTFKDWNGKRFYEEYKYTQKGTDSIEPRLQYKQYDTVGNPIRFSQYGGNDIAYTWSYNKTYPTAKVINASDNEIAYTSFETDDDGNWYINGSIGSSLSLTGNKSFDLSASGAFVSRAELTGGKYYIVSYWSHGGSATVNSGSGTALRTKNGWTLYQHRLTNSTTSVTITGSVVIDELRLYPEDAQMTSYTYKPLVGVTSSNSPNDIISYYGYDDYGRLRTIRDYDNNILKTIDYKYNEAQGTGVSGWASTGGYDAVVRGLLAKEQKDYNSSSPTYNQTRYVPYEIYPNGSAWVTTGNAYCLKNSDSANTGIQEVEYIDTNRYSILYLKKKWQTEVNYTSCPSFSCIGPASKIVSGVCETSQKHYTVSYFDSGHMGEGGQWACVYHYEWSDSTRSDDITEYSYSYCLEEDE